MAARLERLISMKTKEYQIGLPLCKRSMFMSFLLTPVSTIPGPFRVVISDVRDGKHYQLLPEKENTVSSHTLTQLPCHL